MEERKGDARIYIISLLFFACIVTGGVLLCLYIFLPQTQSASWYPVAGIILVGIPWAFWLFAYLYRCLKPSAGDPKPNEYESSHGPTPPAAPASGATTTPNTSSAESPVQSSCAQRRVHFGAVVVLGDEEGGGGQRERDVQELAHAKETRGVSDEAVMLSIESRESEMPILSLTVLS